MRNIVKTIKTGILKEQFIPDTVFLYVVKGGIRFFDGTNRYTLNEGECGIAKKNCLAKYELLDRQSGFEPLLFCFDEPFLKPFLLKHKPKIIAFESSDMVVKIAESSLMENFIQSIRPYYKGVMELDEAFEDLKYEELLLILLKIQPQLSGLLFDFNPPEKLNLEAFMNQNFKFNVSLERFAFLTGRSLSAFKRDFKTVFHETPGHWLVKKRLDEAYLLLDQKNEKPSAFYLDLGFESLSHFSVAFKKQFGRTPTEILEQHDPV